MAVGDRSKNIRQNVMSALKDDSGLSSGQVEVVYDALNRVQRRICEVTECLEDSFDVTLISGQERYILPPDFLRERILIPIDSQVELKKIGMGDLSRLKRMNSSSDSSDISFYYLWNGEIGFLSANGLAPSTSSTVTVYYWRVPDTVSEVMSDSIDPVLDFRWETALYFGAVADITTEDRWEAKFQRELDRVKDSERTNQAEPGQIPVNRDYD